MKQIFRIRTSVRQSYGIIYLYYSTNDHVFSINFMSSGIFISDPP